jgi:hypothetical protein
MSRRNGDGARQMFPFIEIFGQGLDQRDIFAPFDKLPDFVAADSFYFFSPAS